MTKFCKFCRRDLDISQFGDRSKASKDGKQIVAKQHICKACNRVRTMLYKVSKKVENYIELTENDKALLQVIIQLTHDRHGSNLATVYVPVSLRHFILDMDKTLKYTDKNTITDDDVINVASLLGMGDAVPPVPLTDNIIDVTICSSGNTALDEAIITILHNGSNGLYNLDSVGSLDSYSRDKIFDEIDTAMHSDTSVETLDKLVNTFSSIIRECCRTRHVNQTVRLLSSEGARIVDIPTVVIRASMANKPIGVIMNYAMGLRDLNIMTLFQVYDVLRNIKDNLDDDY